MAEGTLQILGLGTSAVPLEYTASGDQSLDLVAVNADYDGSSAMVDWEPVVEIISTAGHVMARGVGPKITAGDSASVTFAPFLKEQAQQTAAGGIQFDTEPQAGQFLALELDGPGTTSNGFAMEVADLTGNGVSYTSPFSVGTTQAGASTIEVGGGNTNLDIHSNGGHIQLRGAGNPTVEVFHDFSGNHLAFFAATPVLRQPTPVTLADVIALLQAYGLCP